MTFFQADKIILFISEITSKFFCLILLNFEYLLEMKLAVCFVRIWGYLRFWALVYEKFISWPSLLGKKYPSPILFTGLAKKIPPPLITHGPVMFRRKFLLRTKYEKWNRIKILFKCQYCFSLEYDAKKNLQSIEFSLHTFFALDCRICTLENLGNVCFVQVYRQKSSITTGYP